MQEQSACFVEILSVHLIIMKTQPKRGRPKKQAHELQTDYLDVRLVTAEKETFKAAADLAGMPLSMWVRDRLRTASRKELDSAGRPVAFRDSPNKER
jgi:hypothetical protein